MTGALRNLHRSDFGLGEILSRTIELMIAIAPASREADQGTKLCGHASSMRTSPQQKFAAIRWRVAVRSIRRNYANVDLRLTLVNPGVSTLKVRRVILLIGTAEDGESLFILGPDERRGAPS